MSADPNDFYGAVWQTLNCVHLGTRTDHIDVLLPYLFEEGPEGLTEEGLLEYFRYADEGGVVEELIFDRDGEYGPERIFRVIDLQAGPGYGLPPARYEALIRGED